MQTEYVLYFRNQLIDYRKIIKNNKKYNRFIELNNLKKKKCFVMNFNEKWQKNNIFSRSMAFFGVQMT